jgi:hypothetical protein
MGVHRGEDTPCLGVCIEVGASLSRGSGEAPSKKKVVFFASVFLAIFKHMVFIDGFLISVKELWLLTNPNQWIRVFLFHGILYMYFILNNEDMMNTRLEVWL